MCPAEQLREPHVEGNKGRTLLSWMGSQLSLLPHGPCNLFLSFSGPMAGTGGGTGQPPAQQGQSSLAKMLGTSWLGSASGGWGGAGATFQLPFQLLLDNLSISCLGCKSQPFPSRPPPASARCLALH